MLPIHEAAISACKNLNLKYLFHHKDDLILEVIIKDVPFYFVSHCNPFDRSDFDHICRDKDFLYTLVSSYIKTPKWKSYLDPSWQCWTNPNYNVFRYKDIEAIADDILNNFSFPVVIKKNRGSMAINVFIAESKEKAIKSLKTIFNKRNEAYDYCGLAQEYLDVAKEYRAVVYKGKVYLLYEKNLPKKFRKRNLGWTFTSHKQIEDKNFIDRIENFVRPIYENIPIKFAGFDLILDKNNELWFLEMNKTPMFDSFVAENGVEKLTEMIEEIFRDIINN